MNRDELPAHLRDAIPYDQLRPAQAKAVRAGLLEGKNVCVTTPTASGKTLIAALAALQAKHAGGMTIYIAPLKALASEKAVELQQYRLQTKLSVGDFDESDETLGTADVVVSTPEKLDSLLRHGVSWLARVRVIVVDEVHLLGDSSRGPTLEVLLTMLRQALSQAQICALSATVQNSAEIAKWLGAELVEDSWRPVVLHQGIYTGDDIIFREKHNPK